MNPELITLSDIPFIQEKWVPKRGDWYIKDNKLFCLPEDWFVITPQRYIIFLPLGFNPETGNWQVVDLILEAGDFTNHATMSGAFSIWLSKSDLKAKIDSGMPASDLILKLRWLNELAGGEG